MMDTDTRPDAAAPPVSKRPAATMRPTVMYAVGVLALCGLVLGVGPMIWRSPKVRIPAGATRVNVSLYDYGIRIDPATPIGPGKDAFVITNTGKIPHELVGFSTKAGVTLLPLRADGDVNEDASSMTNVLDTGASLPPGTTKVVTVDLAAGTHYAFVCNLPGHFRLGMRVDITPR